MLVWFAVIAEAEVKPLIFVMRPYLLKLNDTLPFNKNCLLKKWGKFERYLHVFIIEKVAETRLLLSVNSVNMLFLQLSLIFLNIFRKQSILCRKKL